ncbi:MAG: hypothetical protein ABIK83_00285 [Candidatus Zixiibacteriota bacterium]
MNLRYCRVMRYLRSSRQISIGLNAMTNWQALEEGARRPKIDGSMIYRLAREGDLPAHQMGRVGGSTPRNWTSG